MKVATQKALDPKLRRLVHSANNPARLKGDVGRSFANSSVTITEESTLTADQVTKRVLVRLAKDKVPDELQKLSPIRLTENIYAVELPVSELEAIAGLDIVEYMESGRQFYPMLNTSVAETGADQVVNPSPGQPGFDGDGIVVGIIDYGFDFTLDDFRNEGDGSTRVAFLWDQGLSAQAGESAPAKYGYGVEYDRNVINAALNSSDTFSMVRHRPDASSHGTHVSGIAVGNGRSGDAVFPVGTYVGVAPGATIIFVQPSTSDETPTFTDSVHVTEAIAYCFEKADELDLPCVINMSLGQNGGSHDGESIVERTIDRLLEQPGRAMVIAAGNEHIWRGHSNAQLAAGNTHTLRWKVGGGLPLPGGGSLPQVYGDFTPNEMEIWYSSRDRLRVRVIDPDGNESSWVNVGETEFHTFPKGEEGFVDSELFTVLNGDARIYIEVAPPPGDWSLIKSGEWRVELEAIEIRDGLIDAWIERDYRIPAIKANDQSFFVGTDFDETKTLGTPATMRRAISVANYSHLSETPSDSSGRGRTRDERDKPEVAAPGTGILSSNALGGTVDPDTGKTRPARVLMSGTSMSAPHVAGTIALLFQRNPALTVEQVKKILIASAQAPIGIQPFDLAWGYGKMDARAAMDLVDLLD